ncbi:MAG TPA: ABC transporter ATP-binding protein [Chloroflexota bacterium]|nr:ABC transporter ATP-binding protein [Chloroflexota bacterium]
MYYGGGQGGFWRMVHGDENQDSLKLSRSLLRRVGAYAWPYRLRILVMLGMMLVITSLSLIPPLLYRDLIDNALPHHDYQRLDLLAVGMVGIPIVNGLVGVLQRYFTSTIGEGIICDLRRALYAHMQRMSLRFFTSTKTGELMSRLNNDVIGAQQAVTTTVTTIISNALALISTLAIMLALEWRLTLLSILILPLFILPARRFANVLRAVAREQLDRNAQMNALMNETLNISGALLVKLFGRAPLETSRFAQRAAAVRDVGIRQSLIGRWFGFGLSIVGAVGTALVFWVGGEFVLSGQFTIGLIVAFAAYLNQLYGPLTALTNAPVDFATSMVSFERVFEVLDLPVEIEEKPAALALTNADGRVRFEGVSFSYRAADDGDRPLASLKPVVRRWSRLSDRPLSEGDDGGVVGQRSAAGKNGSRRAFDMASGRAGDETSGPDGIAVNGRADDDPSARDGEWSEKPGEPVVAAGVDEDGASSSGRPVAQPLARGAADSEALTPVARPARHWAVEDVDFEIEPGQLAALVGPSGAGKTTITYLLPRLYDPTAGRILIDGHDLRDLTLLSLSDQIGMVTQETYLFHDTIRANLLYARPDASFSDLEAACRAANIYDFIAELSDGYETIVGERGYRLSGGEKQRVAIARVILKDPKILVLDEATSHLDSQSEALIQAALERVMRGRTSLVIAHRLSTILAADVILVMDRGRLVERGTHAELLARDGLYAALYQTQFRTPVPAS